MINWNVFLPTTFFLTFMILKKEHRLPFLLFAGLFLDKIVYELYSCLEAFLGDAGILI